MSSYKHYQTNNKKYANSYDLTKKPKTQSNKVKDTLSKEGMQERIIDWVTFYRRNIHRFAQHYLGLELHWFQLIWLYLMNICTTICIVACRGIGKSYLIAVYACCRAILYPNSKIVIASSTKKQASLIVTEKIQKELMPNSYNLQREIKDIKSGANSTEVIFHNGSSIVVVPANDNARGYRATVIIYEEFRMIKKDIIDSVLQPFLFVRPAPYLNKKEYEHLAEEPMELYISSAWIKQHWMWDTMKVFVKSMLTKGDTYLLGFDYCLALRHKLKTFKQMTNAKKKSDSMTFDMEYRNIMIGQNTDAFFTYDIIHNCQKCKKPFYPLSNIDYLSKKKNKYNIEKQNGEIRVIGIDISMISGDANDNTIFTCARLLPVNDEYIRKVVYIESMNGGHTTTQALRIKELFEDFDADYIALDTQNAGISVYDELAKVNFDEARNKEYPAYECFNDEATKNRWRVPNALPVVFSIKASERFNHEIAIKLKSVLENNKMELLVNSMEGKEYLEEHNKEYTKNMSAEFKVLLEMPFIQTDFLACEMVNLQREINPNTKIIKLKEPRNGRKDRYTSLAYLNYFADLLEKDLYDTKQTCDWSQAPTFATGLNL